MSREFSDFVGRPGLTRISVQGGNGYYTVTNGGEAPARVWAVRGGYRCECGRVQCAHVASLIMCGFVESPQDAQQAA
jgi:hypothetical protein